jgi:hypothetical protein
MAFLRILIRGAAVIVLAAAPVLPARAQVLTQAEALTLAFPDAEEIQRRTAFLDDDQLTRIGELAGPGVDPPSGIVTHYVALSGGEPVGVAYFDSHRVRTLNQVLMIVVGSDNRVQRVETVSRQEPPEYEAPSGWMELFHDRELDPDLSLKGEIPTLTGATLTARAVTDAVRRVLAVHQVIQPSGSREGSR